MKAVLATLILIFGLSGAGFGRELRMTAGEHATFSRIILFMDEPGPWEFGRTETGYALRFGGEPADVDMSEVFFFIPRKRIRRIDHLKEETTLKFELACDCHAVAFELRNGHVALDFKDGPPPPGSRFEAPFPVRDKVNPIDPQALADPPPLLDFRFDPDQKSALQASLARSLANAVADGLVEPVEPRLPTPTSPTSEPDILRHMTVSTQTELSRAGLTGLDGKGDTRCRDGSVFAFADRDVPPFRALGERWREIVDGQFRQSPTALRNLAEQYLYMGFGVEAAQVLALIGYEPGKSEDLVAIARLMDGIGAPDGPFPADQIGCGTALSLWAFLAKDSPQPLPDDTRSLVLGTFFAMPDHLRNHLGPRLAQRFLEVGDSAALSEMEGGLTRRGEDNALPPHLLSELGDSPHNPESSSDLQTMAAGNSPHAANALIALAEYYLRGNSPIPATLPTDLAARAYEMRGTEIGSRLSALALKAKIATGAFRAAARQLDTLEESETRAVRQALLLELVAKAGDADLAEVVYGYPALFNPATMPPGLAMQLDLRLASMGLGDGLPMRDPNADAMAGRIQPSKPDEPFIAPAQFDISNPSESVQDAQARLLAAARSNRARVTEFMAQYQVPE